MHPMPQGLAVSKEIKGRRTKNFLAKITHFYLIEILASSERRHEPIFYELYLLGTTTAKNR